MSTAMSERPGPWVTTQELADALAVNPRHLTIAIKRGDVFAPGRHYRHMTPSPRSAYRWHLELAQKAWAEATHPDNN